MSLLDELRIRVQGFRERIFPLEPIVQGSSLREILRERLFGPSLPEPVVVVSPPVEAKPERRLISSGHAGESTALDYPTKMPLPTFDLAALSSQLLPKKSSFDLAAAGASDRT